MANFVLLLSKLLTYEHLYELVKLSTQQLMECQSWSMPLVFNCLCDEQLDQSDNHRILTPLDFKRILESADLKL